MIPIPPTPGSKIGALWKPVQPQTAETIGLRRSVAFFGKSVMTTPNNQPACNLSDSPSLNGKIDLKGDDSQTSAPTRRVLGAPIANYKFDNSMKAARGGAIARA
jgi:hypothetical protein